MIVVPPSNPIRRQSHVILEGVRGWQGALYRFRLEVGSGRPTKKLDALHNFSHGVIPRIV